MMFLFIKKVLTFLGLFPIVYISLYLSIDFYYNHLSPDAIFIWGDSQTYLGLDLLKINELTGIKVFSAAEHGMGVYDFLVFTETVPKNSTVVVALSKPVQVRPKELDRNLSGIKLKALLSLYEEGYSQAELIDIIKKNKSPSKNFVTETKLHSFADTIVFVEPVAFLEKIHSSVPDYLKSKQSLFMSGIRQLKRKNCKITFLEFPYHPLLQEVENNSGIKVKTERFKQDVLNLFEAFDVDTIQLDTAKNMMYDLTHLNGSGASFVSEKLAGLIKKQQKTTLCIIHWRD